MQGLATWQARARGRDTPRSFNAPRSLPTTPVTISDNSDLLESLRKERTAWSLERDTLQNTILANQKALEEERLRRSACEERVAELDRACEEHKKESKRGIRRSMCQTLCRTVSSLVSAAHRMDQARYLPSPWHQRTVRPHAATHYHR